MNEAVVARGFPGNIFADMHIRAHFEFPLCENAYFTIWYVLPLAA